MQSLRSASMRRLCLSFTASVTRTSRIPPSSLLSSHPRSFASVSPRWDSGIRQFSYRALEEGHEEKTNDRDAVNRAPMNTEEVKDTLFVGNLPYSATESDLRRLLSPYGPMDRLTLGVNSDGRSLGYAHVKFQSPSSAEKVYKDHEENPVTIDGREIRIDFASPRGSRASPQHTDRSPSVPSSTLFVGNLHEEVTKEDMLEVLQPLGGVLQIRLARKRDGVKAFAHVDFENVDEAEKVVENHRRDPIHLAGLKLVVDRAKPSPRQYPPSPRLYFTGWDGDVASLRSHFRALSSQIVDIFFLRNNNPDSTTTSGFVRFRDLENAQEALARFNSPELNLSYARPETQSKPRPTRREDNNYRFKRRPGRNARDE